MPIKATGQGKEGSRDMSYRKISTFHRRSHDSALSDVCDMSNDAMLAADSIRFDDPVHCELLSFDALIVISCFTTVLHCFNKSQRGNYFR